MIVLKTLLILLAAVVLVLLIAAVLFIPMAILIGAIKGMYEKVKEHVGAKAEQKLNCTTFTHSQSDEDGDDK